MSKSLSELFDERVARDAEKLELVDYDDGFHFAHQELSQYKAGAQSVKSLVLELDEALSIIAGNDDDGAGGYYTDTASEARAKLAAWLEGE
jgi:hypothetical protein